jgi:hypothetical protein
MLDPFPEAPLWWTSSVSSRSAPRSSRWSSGRDRGQPSSQPRVVHDPPAQRNGLRPPAGFRFPEPYGNPREPRRSPSKLLVRVRSPSPASPSCPRAPDGKPGSAPSPQLVGREDGNRALSIPAPPVRH